MLASPTKLFVIIKEMFNVGNNTLEANYDLRMLCQRTSTTTYYIEFSILVAKVG